MAGRLWDALRRRSREPAARRIRPNELRRDDVRAERLRREALQAQAAGVRPPNELEEAPRPRLLAEPVAPVKPVRSKLVAALMTRTGMRQAWLLQEILGPPLALRSRGLIGTAWVDTDSERLSGP